MREAGSQESSGLNWRLTHNRLFPGQRAAATYRPVPGILATHRPGAIMDKSGRRGVVRSD
jgi:hypothetical protein